jgi:uncharacterized protein (DUF488 family)
MKIYTIGTSNRTADEFMDILGHYQIQILADVRRFPTSKGRWKCFKDVHD